MLNGFKGHMLYIYGNLVCWMDLEIIQFDMPYYLHLFGHIVTQ